MNKLYIRLDEEYGRKVEALMADRDNCSAQKAGMHILRSFFGEQKAEATKPKRPAAKPPAVKQGFDWGNIGLTADHIKQIEEIKKAAKSPIKTQAAVTGLVNNLIKCLQAGFTLDYVLQEWADRGWKTVKAEWLQNEQGVNNGQNRPQQISQGGNTTGYDRNSTNW